MKCFTAHFSLSFRKLNAACIRHQVGGRALQGLHTLRRQITASGAMAWQEHPLFFCNQVQVGGREVRGGGTWGTKKRCLSLENLKNECTRHLVDLNEWMNEWTNKGKRAKWEGMRPAAMKFLYLFHPSWSMTWLCGHLRTGPEKYRTHFTVFFSLSLKLEITTCLWKRIPTVQGKQTLASSPPQVPFCFCGI